MGRPARGRRATVYGLLLLLYPADLRSAYGAEMTQVLDDLVREKGPGVWPRVALDLAVSVPRTRLESLMNRPPGTSAVTIAILAVGVLASAAALVMFGLAGLPVPLLAAVVLLSQRSRLGLATAPHAERRSGVLSLVGVTVSAVVFLGTVLAWIAGVERGTGFDDDVLLVFNLLGLGSAIGIVVFGASLTISRRRPPSSATTSG